MATAEVLTARIEKMKAARGSGVLEIRHGDERLVYRSVEELNQAISADEQDLAALSGSAKFTRRYNFVTRKGL